MAQHASASLRERAAMRRWKADLSKSGRIGIWIRRIVSLMISASAHATEQRARVSLRSAPVGLPADRLRFGGPFNLVSTAGCEGRTAQYCSCGCMRSIRDGRAGGGWCSVVRGPLRHHLRLFVGFGDPPTHPLVSTAACPTPSQPPEMESMPHKQNANCTYHPPNQPPSPPSPPT